MSQIAQMPHCDNLVLHAPGTCQFCDMYPEAQADRIVNGVNFTGGTDPAKKTCPAEIRRALRSINNWGGNVAYPAKAKGKTCSCGSASINNPRHSDYCDLYETAK